MDWERWLQTNAGVLSLALAIALTLVPLAVAGASPDAAKSGAEIQAV